LTAHNAGTVSQPSDWLIRNANCHLGFIHSYVERVVFIAEVGRAPTFFINLSVEPSAIGWHEPEGPAGAATQPHLQMEVRPGLATSVDESRSGNPDNPSG